MPQRIKQFLGPCFALPGFVKPIQVRALLHQRKVRAAVVRLKLHRGRRDGNRGSSRYISYLSTILSFGTMSECGP